MKKINLNFISLNTIPKGVKSLGVYNENNEKVGNISLGNLVPKSKGDKLYTFGALSDVHLPYDTGLQDFIRALNYFNNVENVDFICISGDMGRDGVDSEWANFKAQVDTHSPNTPVHISAGNHDAGQSAHKTYEYPIQYTGNPLYYSFTQGNDVFIMFGMTFWGDPPFSRESLQWLYEILEENRNKRCFVFQHMMRKGHAGDASGRYSWDGLNNTNGKVFLSLMEHYKNVLWFHGHSHCEFEQQDTLSLPNSNYDRLFGCHSIHIPSCCMTRNEDNGYDYEDSEGYVVDVYENGIHLRGRDFVAEKFLPIASYWIDNTLVEISEKSYVDTRGVIDTGDNGDASEITLPENTTYTLNARDSFSGKVTKDEAGMIRFYIPCNSDTTYRLNVTNLPVVVEASSPAGNTGSLFCWDANKTKVSVVQDIENSSIIEMINLGHLGEIGADNKSFFMNFTTSTNASYIALSLVISTTEAITEDDIKGVIISLEDTGDNTGLTQGEITNEIIWHENTRLSSSSGNYSTQQSIASSSDIAVEKGDVIRVYGFPKVNGYSYVDCYKDGTFVYSITEIANDGQTYTKSDVTYTTDIAANGVVSITMNNENINMVRICNYCTDTSILRVSRNLELS